MHSEAFRIGDLAIHWYGILAAGGFLAAFWTASRRAPQGGLSREVVLDLMPWLMAGALAGARIYYVIAYWKEFAGEPFWEVFMIRRGGLVWYGGLIGASLVVIVFARVRQIPLWKLADVAAPSIPLGHAFGRLGCFMHGCCYGKECSLPWAVHFPASHVTGGTGVHPTQLYEAGLNLVLFLLLAWVFRRKKFDGQVFSLYLVGYALLRATVEVFRGDYALDERYFGGWVSPGQMMGIIIGIMGAVLWAVCRNNKDSAGRLGTVRHS